MCFLCMLRSIGTARTRSPEPGAKKASIIPLSAPWVFLLGRQFDAAQTKHRKKGLCFLMFTANVHSLPVDWESPEDKSGISTGREAEGFPAAFAVCAERVQRVCRACAECVQLPAQACSQSVDAGSSPLKLSGQLLELHTVSPSYLQC
jgi:hypothetical protein